MTAFVDTSVFLRRLLKQPGAFTDWSAWGTVAASELLKVEARRILDRLRLHRAFGDDELGEINRLLQASFKALDFVRLSRAVLQRAADPFPTALGSLDAIHLSSALLWMEEKGGETMFLTHDAQLATAARACGLDVRTTP
ncbi:MAG TPA: type II toxin-antitoxin system VapC family toxin [Bryobacteraceae bacterium]|jgi:predicted nucleic acid-binding protein|nr:type II toxin-antitoxin system VapC family toxin [Bryobacteraceae bacterium]